MNSIHDMGGMHGFGAIPIEEDEPVFHSEWEAKSLALTLAMGSWGRWTLDTSRHAREKLSGQDYLRFTYYERWIAALVNLMVEHGLVTEKELVERAADPALERCTPALKADAVAGLLASGSPVLREVSSVAAFRINQHVRTINTNPVSHTRLPRYARGRIGHLVGHQSHVFAFVVLFVRRIKAGQRCLE